MGKLYTEADMAAAFELGVWRGIDYKGPLNDAGVAAINPYKIQGSTPAKSCRVALKTEKGRGAPYQESATASEPTNH